MWRELTAGFYERKQVKSAFVPEKTDVALFSPIGNLFDSLNGHIDVWNSDRTPLFLDLLVRAGWKVAWLQVLPSQTPAKTIKKIQALFDKMAAKLKYAPYMLIVSGDITQQSGIDIAKYILTQLGLSAYGSKSYYCSQTSDNIPLQVLHPDNVLPPQPKMLLNKGPEILVMMGHNVDQILTWINANKQLAGETVNVDNFTEDGVHVDEAAVAQTVAAKLNAGKKAVILNSGNSRESRLYWTLYAAQKNVPLRFLWFAWFPLPEEREKCTKYYDAFVGFDEDKDAIKYVRIV